MKRLLCIVSGMNAGGAETFLMKIYRSIDRSRYQMDFCVQIQQKGFYDDEIESMGGRIFHIPCKSKSFFQYRKALAALIRREKYQSVLRITSNAFGFLDLKIAKKAGAKVCIARSSNSSDGKGWKAILAHKIGRLLFSRYVDVRLAPSDLAGIYTFGEKAYRSGKVRLLQNGIDLNVYRFDPNARKEIRAEFGIEDRLVIGHIGRFSRQKNHCFLLDVFAKIYEKRPDAVLLLVGKGELEENICAKAEELGIAKAVIFTGVRSDVPALLSAMDVFAFPSLYEGMPNTVIEAQATGLPCLIADTITKEANVTGQVQYLSLESAEEWSREAILLAGENRTDPRDLLREKGYDINAVVRDFIQYCF